MKKTILLAFLITNLFAIDTQITGYGTLGGRISDFEKNYLRFIDNDGTLKSDSVLGIQTDTSFNEHWNFTVQGKVAASIKSDDRWDPTISWAFLSYRPTNDWLFRLGKFRMPLYLNSQNMDIGVTYDASSLPMEIYNFSPSNDGVGLDVVKTFPFEKGELSVEPFFTKTSTTYRFYSREDLSMYPEGYEKGAIFHEIEFVTRGIALTYETEHSNKYRMGFYQTTAKNSTGQGSFGNFSLQPSFIPGMYTYQPDGALNVENELIAFTLGMDINLENNYKVTTEYAYKNMQNADTGPNLQSGYITLSKKIDDWTNYMTFGIVKSGDNVKDLYNNLDRDPFNNIVPSNRQFADSMQVLEEESYTLGTAYTLTPTSKIKTQWSHIKTGDISNYLIDNDGTSKKENINIFSLTYNIVF